MLFEGERVKAPRQPGWGVGQILQDSEEELVIVFFEFWGRIEMNPAEVVPFETAERSHPVLDVLLSKSFNWNKAHHNVYVVLLDSEVLNRRRFREANPSFLAGKSCLYVGMTGLTPEERFGHHKAGRRSNSYVQRFGVRLLPSLYDTFNPMPFELAQAVERDLARRLRAAGNAVWQH